MVDAVRSFLPTDLPALMAHSGLSHDNQAWPMERLGAGETQPTLRVVRDQVMAFGRRRGAWIAVRRQRLQGLAGARRRGGNDAWEIDYLIDATKDRHVTVDLLECATVEAGREGAQKLFLRLPAESDLLYRAQEAGFAPYAEETLYAGEAGAAAPDVLRPSVPADSYPAFRLYCRTAPEATRRFEAASLGEWHAAQERHWLRSGAQLVLERDGEMLAMVRAARQPHGVIVDLVLDSAAIDDAEALIGGAAQAAGAGRGPVFVLVPAASEALARRLEQAGFEPRQQFVSLVRRTARPLALPKKRPVVAKNAVGV